MEHLFADYPYCQADRSDEALIRSQAEAAEEESRLGKAEPQSVLDLEQFAFDLMNHLADDYGIYDDGSFTQAIWKADTAEKLQPIINRLQGHLLLAMKGE